MSASTKSVQPLFEGCHLRPLRSATLQSLWAGYGKALEVEAEREDGSRVSVVVKHVTPPRGSTGDVGHQRKLKSYQVEAAFYRDIAPILLRRGRPAVAEPICVKADPSYFIATLVLSDLRPRFPESRGSLDLDHAKAALTWLADLHAAFFNAVPETSASLLWSEACYWHLETRLEEMDDVKASWPDLHDAAHEIDRLLRTGAPRTLLHGDAKSANFLFKRGPDGVQAAAYDFQYTGSGDGMKDVAYLLCSSVQGGVLRRSEEELVRHYYDALISQLEPDVAKDYPWELAVERFELALLDYCRWMAGWGYWGASDWASHKARVTLAKIRRCNPSVR